MNYRFILYGLGRLLQMLGLVMLVPTLTSYAALWPMPLTDILSHSSFSGFAWATGLSFIMGTALTVGYRVTPQGNTLREGFAIVSLGWVLVTLIGALPLFVFLLHSGGYARGIAGVVSAYTDAFFETMSGFTTTGATIIRDIEVLPSGLVLWRAMTHWLGGMGIVTLALAVFPVFGVAGYQMFRGEMPGPTKERIRPRLAQTAKVLWYVYGLLTVAETVALWLAGMSFFEALCHAFATMATGGFSTRNASVGGFANPVVDTIIIVFMFLAGTNFLLHYYVLFRGQIGALVHDYEFRFYVSVVILATIATTMVLWTQGVSHEATAMRSYRYETLSYDAFERHLQSEAEKVSSLSGAFRHALFQVVSITTTTGFCTADFDVWPGTIRLMLVALMFFGGCAGSTAGGIKMVRILVVLKATWREARREVQPRAILPLRIGSRILDEKQVSDIVGFFCIFVVLFVLSAGLMSLFVDDFTTAVTSVAATLCNIGPGLSGVGATQTYYWIPNGGKWILSACMLLGRLEVFTVLIAISPTSWRR